MSRSIKLRKQQKKGFERTLQKQTQLISCMHCRATAVIERSARFINKMHHAALWKLGAALTLTMWLHKSKSLPTYAKRRHNIMLCEKLNRHYHLRNDTQCVIKEDRKGGRRFHVDIMAMPEAWMEFTHCEISHESTELPHKRDAGLRLLLGSSRRPQGGQLRILAAKDDVFKDIGDRPWRAFVFSARTKSLLVGRSQSIERHPLQDGAPSTTIVSSTGANDFAVDDDMSLVFFVSTGAKCLVHRMTPSGKKMRCMDKIRSVRNQSGCRVAADLKRKLLFVSRVKALIMTDYEGKHRTSVVRGELLMGVSFDSIGEAIYYGVKSNAKYTINKRKLVNYRFESYKSVTWTTQTPNKIIVLKEDLFFTVFGDSKIHGAPVNTTHGAELVYTESGFEPNADVWMNAIALDKDAEASGLLNHGLVGLP